MSIEELIRSIRQESDNTVDSALEAYSAEGAIKNVRKSSSWIPLGSDGDGNCIIVDLDPGERGVTGQVIVGGRDAWMREVKADSLEGYFANLLLQFADNNVVIDPDEDYSWELTGN